MGPKSNDWCPNTERGGQSVAGRGEGHAEAEADTGVMWLWYLNQVSPLDGDPLNMR